MASEQKNFEAYDNGEGPANDDWVQDWAAQASAYKIWRRLRTQYDATIQPLRELSLRRRLLRHNGSEPACDRLNFNAVAHGCRI